MNIETFNLIFRCNKEFSHRQIRGRSLTETQLVVLSTIYGNPGSSQDQVAALVKTDKTTISKAVGELEEKKLIRRKQDKIDRRIMRLKATDAGYKTLTEMLGIHDAWLEKILSCLNEDEKAQFADYISRILKNALALSEEEAKAKKDEKAELKAEKKAGRKAAKAKKQAAAK